MRNLERFWQSSFLSKKPNALFPPHPSINVYACINITLISRHTKLKITSNPYCTHSGVCLHFLFCFMQYAIIRLNILLLLTWGKFKFHVNCHHGRKAKLCVPFFLMWWNNFAVVKINEVVTIFIMNDIDLHSFEWRIFMFINIKVPRLRSTDWKSSLKYM